MADHAAGEFEVMLDTGEVKGPVSSKTLQANVAKGRLGPTVQIRRTGTDRWIRLGDVPQFKPHFEGTGTANATVAAKPTREKAESDANIARRQEDFERLLADYRVTLADAMDLARAKLDSVQEERRKSQIKFLVMVASGLGTLLALRKQATIEDPARPIHRDSRFDATSEFEQVHRSGQYKHGSTAEESAFNAAGQAIANAASRSIGDRMAAEMQYHRDKVQADEHRAAAGMAAAGLGITAAVSGVMAFKQMISDDADGLDVLDVYKKVVQVLDLLFEAARDAGLKVIKPFESELQSYAELYDEVLADMARLHRGLLGYDFDPVLGHPDLCPSRLIVKSSVHPLSREDSRRGEVIKTLARFAYLPEPNTAELRGTREKGFKKALSRVMTGLGIGRRVNRFPVLAATRRGLSAAWGEAIFRDVSEASDDKKPGAMIQLIRLIMVVLTPLSLMILITAAIFFGERSAAFTLAAIPAGILILLSLFVLPTVLAAVSGRREFAAMCLAATVSSVILFPVGTYGGFLFVFGVLPLAALIVIRSPKWASSKNLGVRISDEFDERLAALTAIEDTKRFRFWLERFREDGWVADVSQFDLRGRHQDWRQLGFILDIDSDSESARDRLGVEPDANRDGIANFKRGMYVKPVRQLGDVEPGTRLRIDGVTIDDFLLVSDKKGRKHVIRPDLLAV